MTNLMNALTKIQLHRTVIYWYLPVCYLSAVLAHSYQPELRGEIGKIHLIAAVVTAVSAILLGVVVWLNHQFNHQLTGILNVVVILVIGGIRGWLMYLLADQFLVTPGSTLSDRIFVSMVSSCFWLILLANFVNYQSSYQQRYRSLFAQVMLNRSIEMSDLDLQRELDQVEQSLKTIRLDLADKSENAARLKEVAEAVRVQINEVIRPLSHRLWVAAANSYPKIKIRSVLKDAFTHLDYSYLPFLGLLVGIAVVNQPTYMSNSESFGRIINLIVITFLIHIGFNQIKSKRAISASIKSALELIALGVLPIYVGDLFYGYSHYGIDRPVTLTVYLIAPFLAVVLTTIGIIQRDQEKLVSTIQHELLMGNQSKVQTTQVASYLHNSLQSELLAISQQLESAANSDSQTQRETMERMGALINRSISEDFRNLYASPAERLNQVIKNWSGIIEIDSNGLTEIFDFPEKSVVAVQLIEECLSNIHKHTNIGAITISAKKSNGDLEIKFSADQPLRLPTTTGGGALLLNSISHSQKEVKISNDTYGFTFTL